MWDATRIGAGFARRSCKRGNRVSGSSAHSVLVVAAMANVVKTVRAGLDLRRRKNLAIDIDVLPGRRGGCAGARVSVAIFLAALIKHTISNGEWATSLIGTLELQN